MSDVIGQLAADLFHERATGFVFAAPGVLIAGRRVREEPTGKMWRLAHQERPNGRWHEVADPDYVGAYLRLLAARLDVDLSAPVADRCSACEHSIESYHQPDGCWYAISVVAEGANAVCPCTVSHARFDPGTAA